jgi:imidazolonepropionase-like amidohydrolase
MLEKSPLVWEEYNKDMPGFTVAVNSTQDAKSIIDQISKAGGRLIKTFNKFDSDVFEYLIEAAKERNLPVTHDPGTTFFHSIPMDTAIDLGIRCVEHAKALWQVVLKKELKWEHDSLVNVDPKDREGFKDRVFQLGIKSVSQERLQWLIDKIVKNDVYCCTTLHAFKFMQKQQSEKSNRAMLEKLKILEEMDRYFTEQMIEGNVKILVGQDGVLPQFTFDEMRYLKEAGHSEVEILRGATMYPARWLGMEDQLGSVSPGKRANIVILKENPLEDIENIETTHAVLKGGNIVFRE